MHAGDRVLMSFPAANRDPRQFERPDEVILDREHNRHVAFGAGIHRCAGCEPGPPRAARRAADVPGPHPRVRARRPVVGDVGRRSGARTPRLQGALLSPVVHRWATPWPCRGATAAVSPARCCGGRRLPRGDDFDWRLSVAEVAADGPFSAFDGCDRILVLLAVRAWICTSTATWCRCGRPLGHHRFAGEAAVHAVLPDGPTTDLESHLASWRVRRHVAYVRRTVRPGATDGRHAPRVRRRWCAHPRRRGRTAWPPATSSRAPTSCMSTATARCWCSRSYLADQRKGGREGRSSTLIRHGRDRCAAPHRHLAGGHLVRRAGHPLPVAVAPRSRPRRRHAASRHAAASAVHRSRAEAGCAACRTTIVGDCAGGHLGRARADVASARRVPRQVPAAQGGTRVARHSGHAVERRLAHHADGVVRRGDGHRCRASPSGRSHAAVRLLHRRGHAAPRPRPPRGCCGGSATSARPSSVGSGSSPTTCRRPTRRTPRSNCAATPTAPTRTMRPGSRCCTASNSTAVGGESTMVDAFAIARRIEAEAPELFEVLCTGGGAGPVHRRRRTPHVGPARCSVTTTPVGWCR